MLEIFIYQGHKQAIDILAVTAVSKSGQDVDWCTFVDWWTWRVTSGCHSSVDKWHDLEQIRGDYGKWGREAQEMDHLFLFVLYSFNLHLFSPFTLCLTLVRSHLKGFIKAGPSPIQGNGQQTEGATKPCGEGAGVYCIWGQAKQSRLQPREEMAPVDSKSSLSLFKGGLEKTGLA